MPNENARKVERYEKISISTVNFQLALKELNCVNQFDYQFAPFMVKVLRNPWENRATLGMLPSYSKRVTPIRSNFYIYSRSREPFAPTNGHLDIYNIIGGGGEEDVQHTNQKIACYRFTELWPPPAVALSGPDQMISQTLPCSKAGQSSFLLCTNPDLIPTPALVLLFTLISAITTTQQDSV